MSKTKTIDADCTTQCKSKSHGKLLTSAITKWSVSDEALASFIKNSCFNFNKTFDYEGRTLLHIAASRGRVRLMDWLARHSSDAFINARDQESGFTALHRSVYYGQIHAAIHLMKIGAKPNILDKDGYTAMDHAMLDRPRFTDNLDTDRWDGLLCIPRSGPVPDKSEWGPDSHRIYKGRSKIHDKDVRDFRKLQYERPRWAYRLDDHYEVYMWGSNSNYTLGTGTQQQRNWPELLTCFNRANALITQICLGKFHTVWLCDSGEVWACGQLARAGGPNVTALKPTLLKMPVLHWRCIAVAITLNSTVLLLDNGLVLQYALQKTDNTSQSGTKAPRCIKLPSVKPILSLSLDANEYDDIDPNDPNLLHYGITASRTHVVVWNYDMAFTWGENVGQLGHAAENNKQKRVTSPERVVIAKMEEGKRIECVGASDAATVFTTSHGDVILFHNYFSRKIAHKLLNVVQVCVDAKVSESGVYSRVTVLLLTNLGQIKMWQDTTNTLTRIVFGLPHQLLVGHMTLIHDFIYFTTNHGAAFVGTISRKALGGPRTPVKNNRSLDKPLVKFLEKEDCTSVKITRIPNIHRAVSIHVDNEGLNFGCLQTRPSAGIWTRIIIPDSTFVQEMHTLLKTASTDDTLHDVVFKVGTRLFPAHIFIVASSSDYLYKLYKQKLINPGDKPEIILDNVHPEVFERILEFIYTGTCDVIEEGPCGLKVTKEELMKKENNDEAFDPEFPSITSGKEVSKKRQRPRRNVEPAPRAYTHCDPVRMVQAAAKRLQVMTLHKLLDNYIYKDGDVHRKQYCIKPQPTFDRAAFPELVDTIVVSKEGIEVPAHKCVLAARLEYFHGMFMFSWAESKTQSKVTIPTRHNILLPVINYLYTDQKCPELETSDNIDFVCNMLVISDQLLITRLREMAEKSLTYMINLKNCAEICKFAFTYNAAKLLKFSTEFISVNLCNLLETRALEILDQSVLKKITESYREINPIMAMRFITPYTDAPSDQIIELCAKSFPVNMDITDEAYKKDDGTPEHNRKKGKENKKDRKRYESVSSVTSLDMSNDASGDVSLSLNKISRSDKKNTPEKDSWIEIPTSQQKQQKVVQARLKAIQTAKDMINEAPEESFTKLTKGGGMTESPQKPVAELSRSLQGNLVISRVGPKLSQKQRKKLANEAKKRGEKTSICSVSDDDFGTSPPEKPKNPWNIIQPPVENRSSKPKDIEFNKILTDQKKQKEDHSRIMTKPLVMTQLEDKAIEQLERFYNIHEVDDEWITVHRIALQVSSPQWVHTGPK